MKALPFLALAICLLYACEAKRKAEPRPSKPGELTMLPSGALTSQPQEDDLLCDNVHYSEDDFNQATLGALYPKIPTCLKEWDSHCSMEQIANGRIRLGELSRWIDTVPQIKIRERYKQWISFYADKLDKTEADLKAPPKPKDQEDSFAAEMARAEALEKCLPKPKTGQAK